VSTVSAYGAGCKAFLCVIDFPGSHHYGFICTNIVLFTREQIGFYKIVYQGFPWSSDADADGILVSHQQEICKQVIANTLAISTAFIRFVHFLETGKQVGYVQSSCFIPTG